MAYEESLKRISLPVAADDSLAQYKFVAVNSDGLAAVTGDGDEADGVLQDNPNATGFAGEVAIAGVSKVVVGSAGVTAGSLVTSDSTGAAVDAGTGDSVNGRALETGVEDQVVSILLKLN